MHVLGFVRNDVPTALSLTCKRSISGRLTLYIQIGEVININIFEISICFSS